MFDFIKIFAAGEDGAVTVDWVVLTAALTGLGIVIGLAVHGGSVAMSNGVGNSLTGTAASIGSYNMRAAG